MQVPCHGVGGVGARMPAQPGMATLAAQVMDLGIWFLPKQLQKSPKVMDCPFHLAPACGFQCIASGMRGTLPAPILLKAGSDCYCHTVGDRILISEEMLRWLEYFDALDDKVAPKDCPAFVTEQPLRQKNSLFHSLFKQRHGRSDQVRWALDTIETLVDRTWTTS